MFFIRKAAIDWLASADSCDDLQPLTFPPAVQLPVDYSYLHEKSKDRWKKVAESTRLLLLQVWIYG